MFLCYHILMPSHFKLVHLLLSILPNALLAVDPFGICLTNIILILRKVAAHIENASSAAAEVVNEEPLFSTKQFKAGISLMISHKAGDIHSCTLNLSLIHI